jgi:hypothetical protein
MPGHRNAPPPQKEDRAGVKWRQSSPEKRISAEQKIENKIKDL